MSLPAVMVATPQARVTKAVGISLDASSALWQRTGTSTYNVYEQVPYEIGRRIVDSRDPDTAIKVLLPGVQPEEVVITPYSPQAVHFAGANAVHLAKNGTGLTSVNKFTACAWVKFPAASLNGSEVIILWPWGSATNYTNLLDIAFNNSSDLSVQSYPNYPTDPNTFFGYGSDDGAIGADAWHFIYTAGDHSGSGAAFVQVDGVDVINPANTFLGNLPFTVSWSKVTMPYNGAPGAPNPFDIADLQCWAGQCIDPTVPGNLAKFISGGKPVNPATAAAAFGPQTFLFSASPGNAASFASAGFTLTGTLTTASGP